MKKDPYWVPPYQALIKLGLYKPFGLFPNSLVVGCPAVLGSSKVGTYALPTGAELAQISGFP